MGLKTSVSNYRFHSMAGGKTEQNKRKKCETAALDLWLRIETGSQILKRDEVQ